VSNADHEPVHANRLRQAFARARQENRAALIAYICAGDPSLEMTPHLITAIAEGGADIIEVGVPFSDPTADGVSIQRASERALRAGTQLPAIFEAIRIARKSTSVPIVLFSYYNPLFRYGETQLVQAAVTAGVDGLLIVDLPPEEAQTLRLSLEAAGIGFVPLVAPTTTKERLSAAAQAATGFLYYVSLTGVTGAKTLDGEQVKQRLASLRAEVDVPIVVGFGVKTPSDVAMLASSADGVVVGTALVDRIAEHPDTAVEEAHRFVTALRAATEVRS